MKETCCSKSKIMLIIAIILAISMGAQLYFAFKDGSKEKMVVILVVFIIIVIAVVLGIILFIKDLNK
ncbi:hypothetical protein KPL28_12625 [Clostridium algidicarnis]|uniref:hypothetical protein n=1 Tax=Clostridium algidicarnis TaxID=37659 RepID=UPI001C0B1C10|nr:hypothetical protein [Clostridium algidicarnis]MBU3210457.1 hypothetical protein [Clostridium algidicarnis]